MSIFSGSSWTVFLVAVEYFQEDNRIVAILGIYAVNILQWPKTDLRWYLGVRCRKCKVPILFALDRTEGTGEGQPTTPGKLVLTCTREKCKHQADYSAAAVSRFQKQPDNPKETVRKNETSKGTGKRKR